MMKRSSTLACQKPNVAEIANAVGVMNVGCIELKVADRKDEMIKEELQKQLQSHCLLHGQVLDLELWLSSMFAKC